MLNIDYLLTLTSGPLSESCPKCPNCPTAENDKSDTENLGGPWASPTCPTCPNQNTAFAKSQDAGAERPLSFRPLPGRYWLDPVENGFLSAYKTMSDLSECKGYPRACQRCRALMHDQETCILGPDGGDA